MTPSTLIEFPCLFPVKIIGINSNQFTEEVKRITKKHFSDFSDKDLIQNASQKGNYIALTVTIYALNKDALDRFYQEVTKLSDVKMVL